MGLVLVADSADKTLDLQEQLVKSIRDGTSIPIKIDYMAPDNAVGLVPEPGSAMVDKDFAGAEEWQFNYAITIENINQQTVKEQLFTISQYLQDLTDLQSNNGTFEFEEIKVSSAPAMALKDTNGNVQYLLDIAVLVWTNIN